MRKLDELVDRADPAMPVIQAWIRDAKAPVEVLPCSTSDGEAALLAAQVTTRSPMGALCHGSGGVLVDGGWLRILGGGCPRLPRALMAWNAGRAPCDSAGRPRYLLVADDVIGGFFAVNGGGISGVEPGHVAYLAPDTLRWESLGMGYSPFLCWSWSGRLEQFYRDQRWPSWREEVARLDGGQTWGFYPFLWAKGPSLGERSRHVIPAAEAWALGCDMRKQMGIALEP